jgi:hypothetical protein
MTKLLSRAQDATTQGQQLGYKSLPQFVYNPVAKSGARKMFQALINLLEKVKMLEP